MQDHREEMICAIDYLIDGIISHEPAALTEFAAQDLMVNILISYKSRMLDTGKTSTEFLSDVLMAHKNAIKSIL
jgi:hypothetical protein